MADFLHSSSACLLDLNQPLPKRTHAAFILRTIGTVEAAEAISQGNSKILLKCHILC